MSYPVVDLRSDTVTLPTEPMRAAMARADVGDDVYAEDPTTRALEVRVAEILGKEAALFVPSGTMGNQIALGLLTRPGDEVIAGEGSHVENNESGAAAALWGVQFRRPGVAWDFDPVELAVAVRPASFTTPRSRLVVIENTHNASGGRVWSLARVRAVAERARQLGLAVHLDGARLWNASIATGDDPALFAREVDTVSVCFSKGLGAPVGSALAGTRAAIDEARVLRKRLGGGMRQSGILAAAALYALDHHRDRLLVDHENARALASRLAESPNARVSPHEVETNIVNVPLRLERATEIAERARRHGILLHPMRRHLLRAVTHLGVSNDAAVRAGEVLRRVIDEVHAERSE